MRKKMMRKKGKSKSKGAGSEKRERIVIWLHRNRGALTDIAAECDVSPQFVGMILRGERSSRDGEIERRLMQWKAPL